MEDGNIDWVGGKVVSYLGNDYLMSGKIYLFFRLNFVFFVSFKCDCLRLALFNIKLIYYNVGLEDCVVSIKKIGPALKIRIRNPKYLFSFGIEH